MQVFRKLEDVPVGFGPSLVSVGNFDGVHRAHIRVLAEIVARARKRGMKSVVVTFEPHPMRILRPDSGLKLLTPTAERLRLLEKTEIDAVLLLPFTRDVSLMSPQEVAGRAGFEFADSGSDRDGRGRAGASTADAAIQHSLYARPRTRLWGEVHCP